MHILELPSFFPPLGGLFCLDQAKALQSLGHEVRILSNVQLGATLSLRDFITLPYQRYEHQMDGITVFQSFQRGIPRAVRYNVNHWLSIVRSMFKTYVANYGRPDILHAHCAKWAGYAAMLMSEEYHIPYIITEHLSYQIFRDEFGPAPSKAWQVPLLTDAYRRANCVVHVSKEQADRLACYFGRDYRWQAISNMIDVDFYALRSRDLLADRKFRFCCLANYWPMKGYDVLFDAFRMLRRQMSDIELHIAGAGTDSQACRSQLSDGMTTHGLLDRKGVRDLLYQSDALVLATRSETQGLVLLEAMSTGIPAISTTAIPESVRLKGLTTVPVDDVEALATAMRHHVMHIHTKSEGEAMSRAVRDFASPQVIGHQLSALFTSLLSC